MDKHRINVLVAEKVMDLITGPIVEIVGGKAVNAAGDSVLLPDYSEKIEWAWRVVERMQADGWHYEIGDRHSEPSHFVKFGRGKYDPYDDMFREEYSATGSTPWMAICLAALEAAGVDVDGDSLPT